MPTIAQQLEKYSIPEPNTGCTLWFGTWNSDGYGTIWQRVGGKRKRRLAHVVSWEEENGPVPAGFELDHLCRMRCCINREHLEPVTHAVNMERSIGPKSKFGLECNRGHELTPENTYVAPTGRRRCRACMKLWRSATM